MATLLRGVVSRLVVSSFEIDSLESACDVGPSLRLAEAVFAMLCGADVRTASPPPVLAGEDEELVDTTPLLLSLLPG